MSTVVQGILLAVIGVLLFGLIISSTSSATFSQRS